MNEVTANYLEENSGSILEFARGDRRYYGLLTASVKRMIEILDYIDESPGLTYDDIAADFCLSVHTVQQYVVIIHNARGVRREIKSKGERPGQPKTELYKENEG